MARHPNQQRGGPTMLPTTLIDNISWSDYQCLKYVKPAQPAKLSDKVSAFVKIFFTRLLHAVKTRSFVFETNASLAKHIITHEKGRTDPTDIAVIELFQELIANVSDSKKAILEAAWNSVAATKAAKIDSKAAIAELQEQFTKFQISKALKDVKKELLNNKDLRIAIELPVSRSGTPRKILRTNDQSMLVIEDLLKSKFPKLATLMNERKESETKFGDEYAKEFAASLNRLIIAACTTADNAANEIITDSVRRETYDFLDESPLWLEKAININNSNTLLEPVNRDILFTIIEEILKTATGTEKDTKEKALAVLKNLKIGEKFPALLANAKKAETKDPLFDKAIKHAQSISDEIKKVVGTPPENKGGLLGMATGIVNSLGKTFSKTPSKAPKDKE